MATPLPSVTVDPDKAEDGLFHLRVTRKDTHGVVLSERTLGTSLNREALLRDAALFEEVCALGIDPLAPFPSIPLDGERTWVVQLHSGATTQVDGARSPLAAVIEVLRGWVPVRWLWALAVTRATKHEASGVICTLPDENVYIARMRE